MSKNFDKVKGFHDAGLWSPGMVHNAVDRWITAEEYTETTRKEYEKE